MMSNESHVEWNMNVFTALKETHFCLKIDYHYSWRFAIR